MKQQRFELAALVCGDDPFGDDSGTMDDFSSRSDEFDEGGTPFDGPQNGLDLSALNSAQRLAVEHIEGPLLVLAGPGSGKTRVITHRIANLLCHGVSPRQILGLTFTNKAADEMKHRVASLAPGSRVWISTFHRFCARMLREHASLVGLSENFSILDTADSAKVLNELISYEDDEETLGVSNSKSVANVISMAKNNLMSPEQFAEVARPGAERLAARIYPRYQESLQVSNSVDFDDLLMYFAELLRDSAELRSKLDQSFRYIMVDEYQDTNLAQYAIVRALSQDYPNLAVTGDPDQSIYGWRGASISNILNFEDDYPSTGVVRLEQNYRSTPNILRAADALIAHNQRRKPKRLIAEREEGQAVRLITYPGYIDEATDIANRIAEDIESGRYRPSQIAIFYRVHSISRVIERAMMERGVAYRILNGAEFYKRAEVRDILAYLNLLNNDRNGAAFLRIVNTPARGIGKKTLQHIVERSQQRGIALLDAAREAGLIEGLAKRSAVAVARFVALYDRLRESVNEPVEVVMDRVLSLSGYETYLEQADETEQTERLANARELISSAREYDAIHPEDGSLESYLEQVALVSDTDGIDGNAETATLMSLHSAKGLEYPCVYIIALEEELIPHRRSRENHEDLEEERRLLFVGITRAKEELQLSLAGYRMKRGSNLPTVPSFFLGELPRGEMEIIQPRSLQPFEREPSLASNRGASPTREPAIEGFRVMTAADMLKQSAAAESAKDDESAEPVSEEANPVRSEPKPPPEDYVSNVDELPMGAVVNHAKYGAGSVVATDGEGRKTQVVVRFFGEKKTRQFVLRHVRLQLVRSP